ncbi:MAG TPA: energy transducer TonB [Thermoanaerobaculia bacterium]|nr:energy transducer TonB [Thermoanaerobaculia bacterium]
MPLRYKPVCLSLAFVAFAGSALSQAAKPHSPTIPTLQKGVLYIKGAVPASSDTSTPLPENGKVIEGRYRNAYFGLSYPLLSDWTEAPAGPPPSNSGNYVLIQLTTSEKETKRVKANLLVSAQDLFFSAPLSGSLDILRSVQRHLSNSFKVESEAEDVDLGGRRFARLSYSAPVAGLHWTIFSTEVRCHALLFTISGQDKASLEAAERSIGGSVFTASAQAPACVDGYVSSANVVSRVEPRLQDSHFNPIPARILVDSKGRVKNIHLLSAFPEQSAVIFAAVRQWHFKPCVRDGKPSEVETGVMFGRARTVLLRPERSSHPAPPHGATAHP